MDEKKPLSEMSEEDIESTHDRITEEDMKRVQQLVDEIKKKATYGGR